MTNKEYLVKGLNEVADAVSSTFGAEGKTVIISNTLGFVPHVTKDGVTVAKEYKIKEGLGQQYREIGAQLIKSVAVDTVNSVGDNTTTSVVLAQALVNKGEDLLEQGVSHVELKEGIEEAFLDVEKELNKLSKEITLKDIKNIAKISANNDEELGSLIYKAYEQIGVDGFIDVMESSSDKTYTDVVGGMKLSKGWINPYLVTNTQAITCELEDVAVLLVDGEINTVQEIQTVVMHCAENKKSLLIIADNVKEDVMNILIENKLRDVLSICVVKTPDFGETKSKNLSDLALFCGAKVWEKHLSDNFELGNISKLIASRTNSVLKQDIENLEIQERIEELKSQLEGLNVYEKEQMLKRIANLSSKIGVIYVGGDTEVEMKEKKDRVDDAVKAVQSSLEEGYVAGGGNTLRYISKTLKPKANRGYNLFLDCLEAPYKKLLENANIKEKIRFFGREKLVYGIGINIKKRKETNLFEEGVIDSKKAIRVSLQNAKSMAVLILTTEHVI